MYQVDVEDYRLELNTGKAKKWQKECYDRQEKKMRYKVGGRVMVLCHMRRLIRRGSWHCHITGQLGLWKRFQTEQLRFKSMASDVQMSGELGEWVSCKSVIITISCHVLFHHSVCVSSPYLMP